MLCGDRDETVNHMISKCDKLVQKKSIRLNITGWGRWSILQEVYIWPYEVITWAQLGICPRKWDIQTSLGFWNTNTSPNLG